MADKRTKAELLAAEEKLVNEINTKDALIAELKAQIEARDRKLETSDNRKPFEVYFHLEEVHKDWNDNEISRKTIRKGFGDWYKGMLITKRYNFDPKKGKIYCYNDYYTGFNKVLPNKDKVKEYVSDTYQYSYTKLVKRYNSTVKTENVVAYEESSNNAIDVYYHVWFTTNIEKKKDNKDNK